MPKYFKSILIGLVAASVYFLPGLFESHSGLAQVESPLPEPNSIVTSYAKDFSVSYAEAERRLILQNEMDALESKVIGNHSDPTLALTAIKLSEE